MFSDGKTLDTLLSAEEYQRVRKVIDKAGIPTALAKTYRPWIVTMLIAASDCERAATCSAAPTSSICKSPRKPRPLASLLPRLETIEQQLAALSAVPDDQQIGMLRANLALADRTDDLMETMVNLYLNRRMGAAWDLQLALAEKAGVGADAFEGFKQTPHHRAQQDDARRGAALSRQWWRLHRCRRTASAGENRARLLAARSRLHGDARRVGGSSLSPAQQKLRDLSPRGS